MGSKWLQVSDIEILNISCQWYGLLWYDWVLIKVGINQIIFYESQVNCKLYTMLIFLVKMWKGIAMWIQI